MGKSFCGSGVGKGWRGVSVGLLALAFVIEALTPIGALGAESIGTVLKKRADVYGTPTDGGRERKFPRGDVTFGELIETSADSAVHMRLDDHSELYLGERASLVVDDFVYDSTTQRGRAVYEFTVGTLRFVSGEMEEIEISIRTPNANIGVRGSDAVIFVTPTGATYVNVLQGSFTVTSRERADVPAATVNAGQNVSLSGTSDFSSIGTGVRTPEPESDTAATAPDYAKDYESVKEGGTLDRAAAGRAAEGGGGSSSSSDSGSSSSQ